MPDTDAILTRLGLDPASMRDGDLEVRTPDYGRADRSPSERHP